MIYLDYAASTPLHDRLQKELAALFALNGNYQSKQMHDIHNIIANSRYACAKYINADPLRIFFTSGASESINTALVGAAKFYGRSGKHIITFETEHQVVLKTCKFLETEGYSITVLPVNSDGSIDPHLLESTIRRDTVLVSVNHICNETGHIQDLTIFKDLKEKYGFMLHVDACQSVGKAKLDADGIDFISLSSHKCYGPQGVGALYIRNDRHIVPLIHGSNPVRSGTMSHALIGMMGMAYTYALEDFDKNQAHIKKMRALFLKSLSPIPFRLNSLAGVDHILNICFYDADSSLIPAVQENIYCQSSSACFSGAASHVLRARGLSLEDTLLSLRFSFGVYTQEEDIIAASDHIISCYKNS